MKIVIRILLGVAIVVMAYLCVTSITTPIEFDETRAAREKVVIQNLTDIRNVQIEYRKLNGHYCASADELAEFIENGKMPVLKKEGTLTDDQMKAGLTEESALAIVRRGNAAEIKANGLEGFRRDTTYVTVYEALFADRYTLDQAKAIIYVPYSKGNQVKFQFDTASHTNTTTGNVTPLVQVGTSYQSYLGDLDHQQLVNLLDKEQKLQEQRTDPYIGLRFGSVIEANNNAGNWE